MEHQQGVEFETIVKKHRILVLRPYGPQIRDRMFATLERLGLQPEGDDIVPVSLTDEEVVARLRSLASDVLLCPFNNLKLASGEVTNGLRLLQKIERNLAAFTGVPVLMPVSVFSAPVFVMQLKSGTDLGPVSAALRKCLLPIQEAELDEPEKLAERIREHLEVLASAA